MGPMRILHMPSAQTASWACVPASLVMIFVILGLPIPLISFWEIPSLHFMWSYVEDNLSQQLQRRSRVLACDWSYWSRWLHGSEGTLARLCCSLLAAQSLPGSHSLSSLLLQFPKVLRASLQESRTNSLSAQYDPVCFLCWPSKPSPLQLPPDF